MSQLVRYDARDAERRARLAEAGRLGDLVRDHAADDQQEETSDHAVFPRWRFKSGKSSCEVAEDLSN
nr:hypothetical protein [Candidatus Sigynarchaeota archaeon]